MKFRSPPLFWRTFLLILSLELLTMAAAVPAIRMAEREPRAHRLAQQLISLVQTTRIALVYSDPQRRGALLSALVENEHVRVLPRDPTDEVLPLPDSTFLNLAQQEVIQELGADTRFASRVNGVRGFWISFSIDGDAYWVFISRAMLQHTLGYGWLAWAAVAFGFSLLGAALFARHLNRPLTELSNAARDLGNWKIPQPLPADTGPIEIRTLNESFNRMVTDLKKIASDRAVLLAGISHDLRTPLTRMRLEVEMSGLPAETRDAMASDLDQMDDIVRQFLDYAVPAPQRGPEPVDLSALLAEALGRARLENARIVERIAPDVEIPGYRSEILRAVDNLLANAHRYGRNAAGDLELAVTLAREDGEAVLAIADHGPGIAPEDAARLVRPFERGNPARSGAAGAGLGLAIVARAAALHHGTLTLHPQAPHGLRVEIRFPNALH